MISETPEWLQPGKYIDAKDKYGTWQVAIILAADKERIKVRFDGWALKYDQLLTIHSPKIKPFRSIVRGYTGQKKHPACREYMTYTPELLETKLQQLIKFIKDLKFHNADKINQYLRGQHYIFVDFLYSRNYKTVQELRQVFHYFKLHIDLSIKYLSDITSINPINQWFKLQNEDHHAYAESYYEIFDSIYTILDCYQRLSNFKKLNQAKFKQIIEPEKGLKEYWSRYLQEKQFINRFEDLVEKVLNNNQQNIPVSFVRSIVHLYKSLDTILKDKDKKMKLAKDLEKIIERQCTVKDKPIEETDLDEMYDDAKMIYFKYTWKKNVYRTFQKIRLQTWKNLILTQNLDKKQRGIIKIKDFLLTITNENKECMMIVMEVKEFEDWLKDQKLIQLIFCLNEHQQVLKKGFELAQALYEKQIIGFPELAFIWKACRYKIDNVRKILYSSFVKFTEILRSEEVQSFSDLILQSQLKEDIDVKFFYDVTHQLIVEDKNSQVNLKMLNFIFERIKYHHSEINCFANELIYCDTKSKIWEKFLVQIFNKISVRVDVYFHLMVLNSIYDHVQTKFLQIQDDLMEIIIKELKISLEEKPQENIEGKVRLLLKCIHHLQEEFQIESEHISSLWNSFSKPQNQSLQPIFYSWILKEKIDSYFNLKMYQINSCIDYENKVYIFKTILKNPKNIDYINMKEVEFQIFKQLMLEINLRESKLIVRETIDKGDHKFFRITNPDLVGIKQLWNIFLNCKNENVIYRVVSFLKQLHLNYHHSFPEKQKIEKTQSLLSKLQKNIKDGIRRSNVKLLKHSLIFVKELLYQLNQKSYIPRQKHHYTAKKLIKLRLPSEQVQEIKIEMTATVIELRRIISQKYKIPLQNLTLLTNKPIIKQWNYLPIYLVQIPGGQMEAVKSKNLIYDILIKYIQDNLNTHLISVLSDENSSKEAFTILTEIPQTKQPQEILSSLIKIQKGNIRDKSIHFQMYMLMNVNRLSSDKLLEFSKTEIFSQINELIQTEITSHLEVQLVKQALQTSFKVWKCLDDEHILNQKAQKIPKCLMNIIIYINTIKKPTPKELNILVNCLKSYSLVCKKQPINKIVQTEIFDDFLKEIFLNCSFDPCQDFTVQIVHEFMAKGYKDGVVKPTTQVKLYKILFEEIYPEMIKKDKTKTNFLYFCKLIKYVIYYLGQPIIEKLFQKQNPFWETVLTILNEETDPDSHEQRNTFFEGHLEISQHSIGKRQDLITTSFKDFIFYECLFYDEKETKNNKIKCNNKFSAYYALDILFRICEFSEENLWKYLPKLMKFQRTQYWRNQQMWNVDINMEVKSSTGYVGLQNPGCICYLNSYMQILFMNNEFREKIINLNFIEEEGKNYQILQNMKLLFLYLQHSNKKSIVPLFFTKSIRGFDNKPMIKIFQQMDIDEYSSILFDKIQSLLPKNNNFVQNMFEGVYSNEIISQECNHISETEEKFLSLRLDVKHNIQESLNFLIKGEMLEGQNAYMCQICAKKVKALKRQSIKKLPDYLNICLKRFEYNFQIDQRIKLNNYCQFPSVLSLEEYSQQYLNKETENVLPQQYFEYELKGVVIHTGIVDSGHYYALIEGKDKKWYEFNDGFVSQFDYEKLADEAFGSKDEFDQKVKNAYLLMYQRKDLAYENIQIQHHDNANEQVLMKIHRENKQIQKFHLFFGPSYQDNIYKHTKKLMQHYHHSPKTQQLLIQYYLEFCLLIRIRTNSITNCIDSFMHLEKIMFEEGEGSKVLTYFVQLLSKESVLQELFDDCMMAQKKIILSRFITKIICRKLQLVANTTEEKPLTSMLLKMISTILSICSRHKALINDLLFIIRHICLKSSVIVDFLLMMDALNTIFLTQIQKELESEERIAKTHRLEEKSHQLRKFYLEQQLNDEELIDSLEILSYKEKPFKNNNKEEGWHLLTLLYSLSIEKLKQEPSVHLEGAINAFKFQFNEASVAKMMALVQGCNNTKNAYVVSQFFLKLCENSQERTEKAMAVLKKAFKDLDSLEFRPFLIMAYYISLLEDDLTLQRQQMIIEVFKHALAVNLKYFAELDILHQWILKMASVNRLFRQEIEGSQFIDEIIDQVQKNRKPSAEMLKKQKNPSYSRLNYRYHGLIISSDSAVYEDLYRKKIHQFEELLEKKFQPQEDMEESPFVDSYKAGDEIQYFNGNSVWINCKVFEVYFGLIIIKYTIHNSEQQMQTWETDERIRPYFEVKLKEHEMEIQ